MNRIDSRNRQRKEKLEAARFRELLAEALELLRQDGRALTVIYCSEEGIRRLNRAYRGLDSPTDVLSFPDGEATEEALIYLGDIFICPAVARRNAAEYGVAPEREMEMLHVHGLLHLLGHDHETDQGQMAALQQETLNRLKTNVEHRTPNVQRRTK